VTARDVTSWHPEAMADLDLRRAPDDRRLSVLAGVGTRRIEGFGGRRATAQAGGRTWTLPPTGRLRSGIRHRPASDAAAAASASTVAGTAA
jgi:hypothetical protein